MNSPKMNVRDEVLLAGDTVYMIGMGYVPSEADDGSAAAFLASFKLGV
jgi:glyoxylase-like metal-dependent hydrolase (beta-lactamase superfamily II)